MLSNLLHLLRPGTIFAKILHTASGRLFNENELHLQDTLLWLLALYLQCCGCWHSASSWKNDCVAKWGTMNRHGTRGNILQSTTADKSTKLTAFECAPTAIARRRRCCGCWHSASSWKNDEQDAHCHRRQRICSAELVPPGAGVQRPLAGCNPETKGEGGRRMSYSFTADCHHKTHATYSIRPDNTYNPRQFIPAKS